MDVANAALNTRELSFYQDDGYRIDATLYLPPDKEPSVSVVFCHGYLGTRGMVAPIIAQGLVERVDAAILTFDYSGFGTSEGPRCRLDPWREVRDVRAGVSYMLQEMPSAPVGLFGMSFGGAISTAAAATDARVGALVSVSPFASGPRWMRDLRATWQWIVFQEEIAADRINRTITGSSRLISPEWIMPRDPESQAFNDKLLEEFPERRTQLDIVSADRVMEFDPFSLASNLRSTPTLYMHATRDLLIPFAHAEDLAREAHGELKAFEGIGHYDLYDGQPLIDMLDAAAGWYDRHLVSR
jgi:pimeloyl-ACP methyl ester carboxylesterase